MCVCVQLNHFAAYLKLTQHCKSSVKVKVLVAQLCPTLLRPRGLEPARLFCPWDSPSKNTGVGCHALLQGIFPAQGSNPGLLHCRQILYHLSNREAPDKKLKPSTALNTVGLLWPAGVFPFRALVLCRGHSLRCSPFPASVSIHLNASL